MANIPEHGEVHVKALEGKLAIDIREPGAAAAQELEAEAKVDAM